MEKGRGVKGMERRVGGRRVEEGEGEGWKGEGRGEEEGVHRAILDRYWPISHTSNSQIPKTAHLHGRNCTYTTNAVESEAGYIRFMRDPMG